MVTNLWSRRLVRDRGHHAGEIRAQLGQVSPKLATESDEHACCWTHGPATRSVLVLVERGETRPALMFAYRRGGLQAMPLCWDDPR